MCNKGIRDGQYRHLVHALIDLNLIRKVLKMLRIRPHGNDHLIAGFPEHLDTIPIKLPVLIDRPHGNENRLLCCLFIFFRDRPHGRTDEMISVRETLRAGLEISGGVNDRVGFVIILHNIEKPFDRIPFLLQTFDLFIHFRHGKQHL